MSAWYVSKKHMDHVVALFRDHHNIMPELLQVKPSEMGHKLFEMNAEALKQRYGDEGLDTDYEFTEPETMIRARRLELARSLRCQCCWGDVPDSELYKAMIEALVAIDMRLSRTEKFAVEAGPWSI